MKRFLICFLIAPLFFIGCDNINFTSVSDYTFDAYDGSLVSTEINSDALFSPRQDFATVVYDGYIWVIGGYDCSARGNDDSYREDVYKSSDGENWELVTDDAPFKGRRGLTAAVLKDWIYIFGGFRVDQDTGERTYKNDLWKSQDGINWIEVASDDDLSPRMNHAMLSTDDSIYIFGGFYQDGDGPQYLSDMWQYKDDSWTKITEDMGLGSRASFAYCKAGNYFYLQGGSFANSTQSSSGKVDESITNWSNLWKYNYSVEDATWEDTGKCPSLNNSNKRSEHSLIYYNNNIWMFSGKSNSSLDFSGKINHYGTLNYSISGDAWNYDSSGGIVEPRYGYECEVFNDSIILIGGYSSDGPQNDVWQILESEDN